MQVRSCPLQTRQVAGRVPPAFFLPVVLVVQGDQGVAQGCGEFDPSREFENTKSEFAFRLNFAVEHKIRFFAISNRRTPPAHNPAAFHNRRSDLLNALSLRTRAPYAQRNPVDKPSSRIVVGLSESLNLVLSCSEHRTRLNSSRLRTLMQGIDEPILPEHQRRVL